jgi:hypothetical protein
MTDEEFRTGMYRVSICAVWVGVFFALVFVVIRGVK